MDKVVLHCWALLVVIFLGVDAGLGHPVTGSPPGQELQFLQDLLKRLKEKFERGELGGPDYREGEAEADSGESDLADALPSSLLRPQPQFSEAEVEEQWRKFFASPKRRRYFSGCFGTRLERIGSQTGLGCNIYKARSWRKPRS